MTNSSCDLREKHKIVRCEVGNCETCERVFNWTKQVEQETAEKIYNYLKVKQVICSPEEVDNFVYMLDIKETAKQFGVVIKE